MAILRVGDKRIDAAAQLLALDAAEYEDSLYLFLRAAWKYVDSSPWTDGWPIEAVAEHLQAVADGEIKRLIINIPPRCGKSTITSVAFPAWIWAQPESLSGPTAGPGVQLLHASYANQLVLRDSVKCRRLIESPWYQSMWGDRFTLNSDQNTKSRFSNDKGGERLITSVGAAVTGEGGSIIVVDDPNAANEAFSEANIQSTIEWWDGTMSTRLNDPKTGAFIVIQQRLAEDDLTGHILSKDIGDWTHLCYDAETEILTRDGWVPFPDLGDGVEVLGVNPTTLYARWEAPTRYVRERYIGEMIHYRSQTAELMVTPDHRMVYGDPNDMKGGVPAGGWRVRAASDLPKIFHLPQTVEWVGEGAPVTFGGRLWSPSIFAEFMGWYLSEGCANAARRETRIVQKKGGRYVDEIDLLMKQIPFHAWRSSNNERMWVWTIKDKALARDLEALGNSLSKRAPEALKGLSAKDLQAFLIAYAKGDGHFAVRNLDKITISTASRRMADDLQECAVKAGWASSLSSFMSSSRRFNGYDINPRQMWKIYLRASKIPDRSRKVGSQIRSRHTQRVPYDGMVYCVSVPSSAVVVRRNGRVSISGNCLPMKYEPERAFTTKIGWNDPRKTPGELLWPERFGEPEVNLLERQLGPFAAAGQLQQRPEPAGGGVIKREWWKLWEAPAFPPMDFILMSVDTAYTTKEQNDASACSVWGVFTGETIAQASRVLDSDGRVISERGYMDAAPRVMLMHAWQGRFEFHELMEKLVKTARALKIDLMLIENKASGISVSQELRRLYNNERFGVQLCDPKSQDKLSRLYSVQHIFAEGMIFAPDRAWAEMMITQVGQFPKGKHDDLVDTCSQAVRHLRDIGLLTRAPERVEEIEAMKVYPGGQPAPLYVT